ncbi:unnamed protein product [Discosporangium mesarthrocarpum]
MQRARLQHLAVLNRLQAENLDGGGFRRRDWLSNPVLSEAVLGGLTPPAFKNLVVVEVSVMSNVKEGSGQHLRDRGGPSQGYRMYERVAEAGARRMGQQKVPGE